jgi:hypothetical protein
MADRRAEEIKQAGDPRAVERGMQTNAAVPNGPDRGEADRYRSAAGFACGLKGGEQPRRSSFSGTGQHMLAAARSARTFARAVVEPEDPFFRHRLAGIECGTATDP